ncbi:MAG TPA: M23 family metallopeptidase [Thermoanaerobaculia bacterium]|nr:M23 family metallopeptidase [Thermoanaerobaculia bacterium]
MRWLALLLLAAAIPADVVEVAPGTVVRWPAAEIVECRQSSRRSAPLDGACYFPIDLLARGEIEVAIRTRSGEERRRLRVGPYPYPVQEIRGVEEKYVAPSAAELERIRLDQQRTGALWALASARRFTLPLASPLPIPLEGGRFGARRIFNGEPRSPHGGADYRARPGTPVLAPADGVVVLAEEQFFAGRAVYLDHGDGLISMSFHLSEIAVAEGQEVKRGQLIGRVGATGRVTGPHLHFGLRWRGARIDPAALLGEPAALPSAAP